MPLTPLDPWVASKIGASRPGLSRSALDAWQLQKLNETLFLARAKSPFYRNHFAGLPETLTTLGELARFPFTTPEDVRQNPLKFVCVSQDEIQRVVTLQSSGTTGDPKRIYFTADDQNLTIDFFGVGMSTMVSSREKVLILLPGETPGSVGDLLRLGLQGMGVIPLPYGPVRSPLRALETMLVQKADCLVGSPTQVLGLARRWKPGQHRPRSILLSTDYVPAAIVEFLKRTWECEVYNHYGATEMGLGGGVECSEHQGYHLREADLYFEVLDPISGAPLQPGEYGEVVFTTLTRRGMPLIRYRMGDRSRFLPDRCSCGTVLKTLEKVCGRFSGFVTVGDRLLNLPDFDEVLFPIPDLLNFTVTVSGLPGKEILAIETQMLSEDESGHLVRSALETMPATTGFAIQIHCQHNSNETGSLLKRIILDKRGQNA